MQIVRTIKTQVTLTLADVLHAVKLAFPNDVDIQALPESKDVEMGSAGKIMTLTATKDSFVPSRR